MAGVYIFQFMPRRLFDLSLYLVTDRPLARGRELADIVGRALAGGVSCVQLREKEADSRTFYQLALEVRRLTRAAGAAFIVNDRIDVALAAEADGVHLGQEDFPIPLARKLLGPDRIVGGSAVTLAEAEKCLAEGADYVGFGPVFPTTSKDDAGPATGLARLREVVLKIPLPIVGIGGIDSSNAAQVLSAGAHGLAVISSICCQEDPARATRDLLAVINRTGG